MATDPAGSRHHISVSRFASFDRRHVQTYFKLTSAAYKRANDFTFEVFNGQRDR